MQLLPTQEPQQFCSEPTAIALATAAYKRAANLARFGERFVGIGATCALASEQPKKGEHRAYIAAHGQHGTQVYSLRLAKGARSRWQEDGVVSRLLLMVGSSGASCSHWAEGGLMAGGWGQAASCCCCVCLLANKRCM